jgi:hypothetical protein
MNETPQTVVPGIDWGKVKIVLFFTAATFLVTLLAAWGSSDNISWAQAMKAASLAAAGYAGGKFHR